MICKSRYDVRLKSDPDQLRFVILTPDLCEPDRLEDFLLEMLMGELVLMGREEFNEIKPSIIFDSSDVQMLAFTDEEDHDE